MKMPYPFIGLSGLRPALQMVFVIQAFEVRRTFCGFVNALIVN
jgi:hypothetical protein